MNLFLFSLGKIKLALSLRFIVCENNNVGYCVYLRMVEFHKLLL